MIKLSNMIDQDEVIEFKDVAGNIHTIKLFIPIAVSLIQKQYEGDKDNNDLLVKKVVEAVLKSNDIKKDLDWMESNLSLPDLNFIYFALVEKMNEASEAFVEYSEDKKSKKKQKTSLFLKK